MPLVGWNKWFPPGRISVRRPTGCCRGSPAMPWSVQSLTSCTPLTQCRALSSVARKGVGAGPVDQHLPGPTDHRRGLGQLPGAVWGQADPERPLDDVVVQIPVDPIPVSEHLQLALRCRAFGALRRRRRLVGEGGRQFRIVLTESWGAGNTALSFAEVPTGPELRTTTQAACTPMTGAGSSIWCPDGGLDRRPDGVALTQGSGGSRTRWWRRPGAPHMDTEVNRSTPGRGHGCGLRQIRSSPGPAVQHPGQVGVALDTEWLGCQPRPHVSPRLRTPGGLRGRA